MSKIFLTSDTHFGHGNILNFKRDDGTLLRPGFKDIHDHDLELIKRWNYVVSPEDKVYHLGDVGFKNFAFLKDIFSKLNGTKVLIKGNHDNFKINQYAEIFKDVRAYHVLGKYVLSHVPIHPYSLDRWDFNIHGHLHYNKIDDKKYINVCVEHTNFTPINFEDIRKTYESTNA